MAVASIKKGEFFNEHFAKNYDNITVAIAGKLEGVTKVETNVLTKKIDDNFIAARCKLNFNDIAKEAIGIDAIVSFGPEIKVAEIDVTGNLTVADVVDPVKKTDVENMIKTIFLAATSDKMEVDPDPSTKKITVTNTKFDESGTIPSETLTVLEKGFSFFENTDGNFQLIYRAQINKPLASRAGGAIKVNTIETGYGFMRLSTSSNADAEVIYFQHKVDDVDINIMSGNNPVPASVNPLLGAVLNGLLKAENSVLQNDASNLIGLAKNISVAASTELAKKNVFSAWSFTKLEEATTAFKTRTVSVTDTTLTDPAKKVAELADKAIAELHGNKEGRFSSTKDAVKAALRALIDGVVKFETLLQSTKGGNKSKSTSTYGEFIILGGNNRTTRKKRRGTKMASYKEKRRKTKLVSHKKKNRVAKRRSLSKRRYR